MASTPEPEVGPAQGEVVDLVRELIRVPSINFGEGRAQEERTAAELVEARLAEAGLEPRLYESEPGRVSCVARLEGSDPSRTDALLVHGHLDVVPVDEAAWSVDPFAAEVRDGMVWGRGAVDMKDMVGMSLALARQYARSDQRPARDVVLAFLADEEAGGHLGAGHLVAEHAELFADCTEAISEVGGFSLTVNGRRLYLLEAAQKGMAWMRLVAEGTAGHGSMVAADNPVVTLAEAVRRIGEHEFAVEVTPVVRDLLDAVTDALGVPFDETDPEGTLAQLGGFARMAGAVLRDTANPTMLDAGYKVNVVPGTATAHVDGRFLPGHEESFGKEIDELLPPGVRREWVNHDVAVQTTPDGPLWDAMVAALRAEDPDGVPVPYMLSGGTDAKHFSRLGIRCFGFSPLRLPDDLDFTGMFHGVDERVPVDALHFGVRALDRFLRSV